MVKTHVAVPDEHERKASRLAQALRMYLDATETTQKQLAAEISCDQSAISRFLDGKELGAENTLRLFQWMLGKSGSNRECEIERLKSVIRRVIDGRWSVTELQESIWDI